MNSFWIIFIVAVLFITIVFIVLYWLFGKDGKDGKDGKRPPMVEHIVEPTKQTPLEKINTFFNQTQKFKEDGYYDASKNDTIEAMQEGLMRIKNEGEQMCDKAILHYQKEIRRLENEIKEENRFIEGKSVGNSTQADRKTVEKDNLEKDIAYITEKKSSLEKEDLGIYVSYRAGFVECRNDKNK
jgi:hypothetical protein